MRPLFMTTKQAGFLPDHVSWPRFRILLPVLAVYCVLWLPAAATADEGDHPLVTRYEGSELRDSKVAEFDSYQLVTDVSGQGEFSGETLEGRVTRLVYGNPADRSTLEIFENYRKALGAAGIEVIFTCALNECGPAFARSGWNRYNGLFAAADGDPRYLAGKLSTADGTAYVALMVGRTRTQLDVVEIVAMEEDKVVADAAALARGMEEAGSVSVYGIYFDVDKADIKPESKPALDEIAVFLRQRPELNLYVVGHTDMTGGFQHNQSLSQARARAVVQALVKDYGIEAGRLEGHGVGPLAPVAANTGEGGRAMNRRVELVGR